MVDTKTGFRLVFPENERRDVNISTLQPLSYDRLGDFIDERDRIKRVVEANSETDLKVDYSDLSNHVFFDSAVSKFDIAKNRILEEYPYNGNNNGQDMSDMFGLMV
jgi:hypothetical protein